MMLNISADHLGGDLVSHRAGKIVIFPAFSTPKTPLDPGKLSKDSSSTQALESGHDLDDGIPGREGAKDMDMIWAHLHFLDGNVILLRNIGKQFPHPWLDLALQDGAPVLGRPNQVVQGIVNGMGCTSENHAATVPLQADLGSGHRAHCQDRLFPPAASGGAA